MPTFNYIAGFGASAVLSFLSIPAILTFWGLSLRRPPARIQSPPLRMAHLFLKIAPPIYAVGVLLVAVSSAILAAWAAGASGTSRARTAGRYLSIVGVLLTTAGNIGLTIVLYLATVGSVYVALGRMVWWKLFRVDAPIGGALLLVLDIAYFGRSIHIAVTGNVRTSDLRLGWLLVIIDLTLALLAAGVFGTTIYVMSKLKTRGDHVVRAMGKTPALILVSSILWLLRSCYAIADMVKTMNDEYTIDESNASLFIYPIFEHWINAVVTGLFFFVVRKNLVWADPSIQPQPTTSSNPIDGQVPQQWQQPGELPAAVMAQYPGHQVPVSVQYYQHGQGQGQPPQVMYVDPQQQQQQPLYYTNLPPPQHQQYQGQSQGQPQIVYVHQLPAGSPPPHPANVQPQPQPYVKSQD